MYEYSIIAWDKQDRKYVLAVFIDENPSTDGKFVEMVREKMNQFRKENPNMVYGWEKHLIPLI